MKFELKVDGTYTLATWDKESMAPVVWFPRATWPLGVLMLNSLPVVVKKWVKAYAGGRLQWTKKVGEPTQFAKRK